MGVAIGLDLGLWFGIMTLDKTNDAVSYITIERGHDFLSLARGGRSQTEAADGTGAGRSTLGGTLMYRCISTAWTNAPSGTLVGARITKLKQRPKAEAE